MNGPPEGESPCSAREALELCDLWTRRDRDIYADAPFVTRYDYRLTCIAEGQADLRRLVARIASLQQDMRTIMMVTRWDHQAHQIAKRALQP
jgi:hypothetical protein